MAIQKGKILKDKYKILDILGKGGQGCVYRAYDMKRGFYGRGEVAIKEMRRGRDWKMDMVNMDFFRQEVQTLAQLRHPYLPRVFDVFTESGSFYIVEEYIEGPTLEVYLRKEKKVSPLKAVDLALRIADILDYLHQQYPPIYYRDLKPANLIIQPGRLYLVDFSGCYIPMMGFGEGVAVRTRGYCPPEAYTTTTADPTFDVYTLGIVLYQMVTGANVGEFSGTPPPLDVKRDKVPPELVKIINKAIKKNKMSRYHTIWEMKIELESLEKQIRATNHSTVPKEGEKLKTPKTPLKYILKNAGKKILFPLLDILVLFMIPAMIVRPAYAKFIPFAHSETAPGWKFYILVFLILIIHIIQRHFIDWIYLAGTYFRYLHFPIRNYFDIRPIRWFLVLEIILILYIYFKILTL
ncbi:MAG: serine/threonine protein kinase [Candidatus Eremiobacteraeota bacterium]|nr:serine/threonine protein kinase [Candidatus Eremiobacteraeota bacterium]